MLLEKTLASTNIQRIQQVLELQKRESSKSKKRS